MISLFHFINFGADKMHDRHILPQKNDAILLSNVDYNVPGLFSFSELVYRYIDIVKCKFDVSLPIVTIYGSPAIKWNSGRLLLHSDDWSEKKKISNEILSAYNNGIIPLLTFSNPTISLSDLNDSVGNYILNILDEIHGEVIVTSPILEEYISEYYPNVKIHLSVISTSYQKHRTLSYYKDLSSKYHRFVIHPDDLFDDELICAIPKDNAEIMINERCKFKCEMRDKHYDSISREQQSLISNQWQDEHFLSKCNMIPEIKQCYSYRNNISCSISEVQTLVSYEYKHIKLQGRLDNLYTFFFDLMRFTLENNVAFPHLYPIFNYEIEEFQKRGK